MAENLGLDPGEAEIWWIFTWKNGREITRRSAKRNVDCTTPRAEGKPVSTPSPVDEKPSPAKVEHNPELERLALQQFHKHGREMMIFIPSADFTMEVTHEEGRANERPLTHVTRAAFISRDA